MMLLLWPRLFVLASYLLPPPPFLRVEFVLKTDSGFFASGAKL